MRILITGGAGFIGANTANSLGYLGQLLSWSSLAEFFKTPEFRNLEVGICHSTCIIKEDFYLAMTL